MEQKTQKKVLPFHIRFSYGVGHVLNDLCGSMWFSYLLIFMHLVLNFSNEMAGYVMLLGQVVDAISTPFVGYEIDRCKKGVCGIGKRKCWHLIGTIFVAISFPVIFNKCIGCVQECEPTTEGMSGCWPHFVYYLPFVIIFQFGWASVQIAHLSLIPVLTSHSGERVELTSIRNAFTVIAGITVYSIAWGLLESGSAPMDDDANSGTNATTRASVLLTTAYVPVFRNLVLIVVGIGVALQVFFYCGTPENETPNHEITIKKGILGDEKIIATISENICQTMHWKNWFKEVQFYQIGMIYTCTRLVVNLSQVYMAMYLSEDLQLPKDYIAIIPLVIFISSFLMSLFQRPINAALGRKVTYLIGAILVLSSCTWMWFLYGNDKQILGVAILLGFGNSIMLVNSISMVGDLIGNHTNSGAFVYGAMSFADKISNGLVIVGIQHLHLCLTNTCPFLAEDFYRKIITFVPGCFTVVALVTLFSLRKSALGRLDKYIAGNSETVPLLSSMSNSDTQESNSFSWECDLCLPASKSKTSSDKLLFPEESLRFTSSFPGYETSYKSTGSA